MNSLKSLKRTELLILLALVLLYLFTAPFTVQSGDTGELVTNSFFLRVSHPPGYPLWTLLYHFPTKYLNFGNPFQAASLFTILISATWLGILLCTFKEKGQLLVTSVFATSLVVWRYAVLPDVFALHTFFLVLVLLTFMRPELLEKPWMIFLISLSVAHHHTIVLAFPLFLYAALKKPTLKKFLYCVLFGVFSLSLYCFLFLFHPQDYGSWKELNSLKDLVDHFLRRDYGTFSLSQLTEAGSSWFEFFITHLLQDSWSMILILIFFAWKKTAVIKANWIPLSLILSTMILYLVFFEVLAKIDLDAYTTPVYERFLIQPTLFLFFLVLYIMHIGKIELPKILMALLLVNTGLNLVRNFEYVNYRENTAIEDFIKNQLNSLPERSVYYTYGDTSGFGTYYVKEVLNVRPDVIQILPTWGYDWERIKFKKHFPEVMKVPQEYILESFNFDKYRFFSNQSPTFVGKEHAVTFWGLIFEVKKFTQKDEYQRFNCDLKFEWRKRFALKDFEHFEAARNYDLQYGNCYFTMGMELIQRGDFVNAETAIKKALDLSPFNAIFQERLCNIYKETRSDKLTSCEAKLDEMLTVMHPLHFLKKQ